MFLDVAVSPRSRARQESGGSQSLFSELSFVVCFFALGLHMPFFFLWSLIINHVVDGFFKRSDQHIDIYIIIASTLLGLALGTAVTTWSVQTSSMTWLWRGWESLCLWISFCGAVIVGSGVVGWGLYVVFLLNTTIAVVDPTFFFHTKVFVLFQPLLWLEIALFLSLQQNGITPARPQALLETVLQDAPELRQVEDHSARECPICQEPLVSAMAVVRTTCEHLFHSECLDRWCQHHLSCPTCRAALDEQHRRS